MFNRVSMDRQIENERAKYYFIIKFMYMYICVYI